MISLSLSNATLILGARAIFRNLTWEIQDDQRVGLVGLNGAGKSSLFKLLAGEHTPEPGGAVTRAKGITVGYLPQEPALDPALTAPAAVLAGNVRLSELHLELGRVEARLADPTVYGNEKALSRALALQQKLLDEFTALGGENFESRVRETLRGLGLPDENFNTLLRNLSGGQKKLVGLARLILARPAVLLLDEPDNHLDLPGKEFLERLIVDYPGAVVIVSHDRYLLDAVVTHIAEIEDGKLTTFSGDYSAFILDKDERLARQAELYQIQQRKIVRMQAAVKRYALWTLKNDKFASRLRAMRTRIQQLEKVDRPVIERRRMGLALSGWRGSNKVLELSGVRKSFGSRPTLRGVNLLLWHGERVGLIGANGAGKSVLLRLITGQERPDAGEIKLGPSVQVGYYAQEHETLNYQQTLMEAVRNAARITEEGAVAFLRRYLFTYQQSTQHIGSLSGGERSRLQLALLALPGSATGPNFLLLDEPTNNLDIASAEVLEQALGEFEGTVLIISHDRYFLDSTVQRIVELKDGVLAEYLGGYSDYAEKAGRQS